MKVQVPRDTTGKELTTADIHIGMEVVISQVGIGNPIGLIVTVKEIGPTFVTFADTLHNPNKLNLLEIRRDPDGYLRDQQNIVIAIWEYWKIN